MRSRDLISKVKQAYKKTGLAPVCGRYGDGLTCGCPVTALAIANHCRKSKLFSGGFMLPSLARNYVEKKFGLSREFVKGLISGFDGIDRSGKFEEESDTDYKNGYAVGRKLNKELIKDGESNNGH